MGGVTTKIGAPSINELSLNHTSKEMILAGLTPNMASCNAALCAAKVAGRWQEAEELLEKPLDSTCIPGCLRDFKVSICIQDGGFLTTNSHSYKG